MLFIVFSRFYFIDFLLIFYWFFIDFLLIFYWFFLILLISIIISWCFNWYFPISYERKEFDEIKVFDLVKDGSTIQVTEENKREFVKIFASTKMGLEIQQQAQYLIQGIHEIIPSKAISLLDEKELGLKIAGMPEINSKLINRIAIFQDILKKSRKWRNLLLLWRNIITI